MSRERFLLDDFVKYVKSFHVVQSVDHLLLDFFRQCTILESSGSPVD